MNRLIITAVIALMPLVSTDVFGAPPWTVQADYQVKPGKASVIRVLPNIGLTSLALSLTSTSSAQTQRFERKNLKPGKEVRFKLMVPRGRSEWVAAFTGKTQNEMLTSTFKFEVISVGPLSVDMAKTDVDLSAGVVRVKTNEVLKSASVQGYDLEGQLLFDEDINVPQTIGSVAIKLPDFDAELLRRLEIKVHDLVGRWVGFRLVAWYVEIPHEDVVFDTGSHEIRSEEAGKLDAVVARINAEVSAFRKMLGRTDVGLDLKLYIAGCTDTVGATGDNDRLSRARARSIATYFRRAGVKSPIYFEGYGESLLAVSTGDQVDEPRNRRAIYVLTNAQPEAYNRPGRRWRKLN